MIGTQCKKRIDAEKRVREELEACVAAGEKPTFYTIAQRTGIARSTIYRRDDLRNLVEAGRRAWTAQNAQNQERAEAPRKARREARGDAATGISVEAGGACAPCTQVCKLQTRIDLLERQLEQAQMQLAALASLVKRLEQPRQPGQPDQSDQPDREPGRGIHAGPRAVQSYIATLSVVGSGANATVRLESCVAA